MNKTKILIVEDETLVAMDLKNALEKLDFKITSIVSTHKDIMKSIKNNEPDIIMMDIKLGEIKDGIEISKDIHKTKNIPILYLTAFSDDETMERAFQANPIGYLIKPFKREDLKSTIQLAMYKINKINHVNINNNSRYIGFDYYYDIDEELLYYKDKHIKLGRKERILMTMIVKAKGNVIHAKDLEEMIWRAQKPSHSALRTLVYRLKSKLGCQIIETTYSYGYRLAPIM
ncbi:MAG: response regulator [Campylobacterota bacterium]|nr:response regulator [Campylobacterota bacterium]